jgi:hypothetical protein
MKLFYKSLYNKIPPKECANSLPAERKKTKNLQTKIPDPNETWGHFFKRVATMDLYNPPLVDKKNVSQMNSLYMSTQMKLMENEYGIKMSYYNPNENTRNVHKDEEEEEDDNPIFNIQNTEKKRLKEESQNDKDNKNNANNSDNVSDNNTSNNVLNIPMSKRNKQRKLEEIKLGSKDNIVININNTNKSSDRPIIKKNNNEDEEKV